MLVEKSVQLAHSHTMFSTLKSNLMRDPEDQKDARTELLAPRINDENASTSLEKPKRGQLPRERSQNFRFSRQDSPSILVSDFTAENHRRDGAITQRILSII